LCTKLILLTQVKWPVTRLLGTELFYRFCKNIIGLGLIITTGFVCAEELPSFQPFDLSTSSISTQGYTSQSFSGQLTYNQVFTPSPNQYDFLNPQPNGYHLSTHSEGLFGDELVVGMKFADWLTVRLNVIDDNNQSNLFNPGNGYPQNEAPLDGYQLGLSSVMNLNKNWRLGFDLGHGKVGGEVLGLYQDQLETTSLGVGIRNQKFGAKFQSDILNRASDNVMEQATMDLQVDWYFTKDGTISFGARKHVNDNQASTSLDQLTGTVPYIKFKHDL